MAFGVRGCSGALVESGVRQLTEIFGIGVYAIALMACHVHLVVAVLPDAIPKPSDEEIVERWLQPYPSRTEERVKAGPAEMQFQRTPLHTAKLNSATTRACASGRSPLPGPAQRSGLRSHGNNASAAKLMTAAMAKLAAPETCVHTNPASSAPITPPTPEDRPYRVA